MTDIEALIQAFTEEVIRRKKTEALAAGLRAENQRLAGEIADLKKGTPAAPPEAPHGD